MKEGFNEIMETECEVGDDGAIALGEMLKTNSTLCEVDICSE